VMFT